MSKPKFTIENWIPEKFYERGVHVETEDDLRYLGQKNLNWLSSYWAKKAESATKRARYAEIMHGALYDAEAALKRERVFPNEEIQAKLHEQILNLFEMKIRYVGAKEDYEEAAGLLRMLALRSDDKPVIFTDLRYKEGENVVVFQKIEMFGVETFTYLQGTIIDVDMKDDGMLYVTVGFPEGVAEKSGVPDRIDLPTDDIRLMKLKAYHYFERDPGYFRLYLTAKSPRSEGPNKAIDLIDNMVDAIKFNDDPEPA